eukprot:403354205
MRSIAWNLSLSSIFIFFGISQAQQQVSEKKINPYEEFYYYLDDDSNFCIDNTLLAFLSCVIFFVIACQVSIGCMMIYSKPINKDGTFITKDQRSKHDEEYASQSEIVVTNNSSKQLPVSRNKGEIEMKEYSQHQMESSTLLAGSRDTTIIGADRNIDENDYTEADVQIKMAKPSNHKD